MSEDQSPDALTWLRVAQYPEARLRVLGDIGAVVHGINIGSPIVFVIGQLFLRKEPLRSCQGGDDNGHRYAARKANLAR